MTEQAENPRAVAGSNSVAVAGDKIESFLKRVETLEEEKAGIAGDIKEVFAEAKGNGFNTAVLKALLRIRKQDKAEREQFNAELRLYGDALGMTVFD